jgi:hypothetical protein
MDETVLQLNNTPGSILTEKGARRDENVSVIAYFNALGTFILPIAIMKDVRQVEFSDGLLLGSKVFTSTKFSYICGDLFLSGLKNTLPQGNPTLKHLILDGQSAHVNNLDVLEFVGANLIILHCLSSHTTQILRPLTHAFLRPLKYYFRKEVNHHWMLQHKNRKITRIQAGMLIGRAWTKAASVQI